MIAESVITRCGTYGCSTKHLGEISFAVEPSGLSAVDLQSALGLGPSTRRVSRLAENHRKKDQNQEQRR